MLRKRKRKYVAASMCRSWSCGAVLGANDVEQGAECDCCGERDLVLREETPSFYLLPRLSDTAPSHHGQEGQSREEPAGQVLSLGKGDW